MGYNSENL